MCRVCRKSSTGVRTGYASAARPRMQQGQERHVVQLRDIFDQPLMARRTEVDDAVPEGMERAAPRGAKHDLPSAS